MKKRKYTKLDGQFLNAVNRYESSSIALRLANGKYLMRNRELGDKIVSYYKLKKLYKELQPPWQKGATTKLLGK